VYHGCVTQPLQLELDRSAKTTLAEQIRKGISAAIESGVLAPGARLPSWPDLAAQLGVARGTVSLVRRLRLLDWAAQQGVWVARRPRNAPTHPQLLLPCLMVTLGGNIAVVCFRPRSSLD
jgi:GntR family transcriptional regulator / MocR family aminotransferase